jgi:chromosome segregation ATPase
MSQGLSTIAIAGVAAIALGVGGWMMMSGDDEPSADATSETRKAHGEKSRSRSKERAARSGDLESRVAELEAEVSQMRQELNKLKMVRGSAAARGATVGSDSPDALDEAPQFEGAVRDIIESEREEAREKRTDAMRDRFSERHGEALDELVAVAGLNQTERESIEGLWETETEQLIPMFMAAREGERPFGEVREEADKLRTTTDNSVEEMLTAAQFEQYKELRPGPPGRRRGGDRRGGERRGPPPQ